MGCGAAGATGLVCLFCCQPTELYPPPLYCFQIRKKDFVKIKNRPCKVVFVHSFKNGKHGGEGVGISIVHAL